MFVLLEGRSRQQAFKIGEEIAAAATASNPPPVALKLEKVYHPCILQTKKRYVGLAYDSPHPGARPVFDAKGIETVRRDGCPAVVKILERSLEILFRSHDLSKVRGGGRIAKEEQCVYLVGKGEERRGWGEGKEGGTESLEKGKVEGRWDYQV